MIRIYIDWRPSTKGNVAQPDALVGTAVLALHSHLLHAVTSTENQQAAFLVGFQHVASNYEVVDIVARLHHGKDLAQAPGADEGISALAALGIIRHRDLRIEEPGEHLPPAGPGLDILVHDRRIPAEEDGGHARRRRFDAHGGHGRGVSPDLQGQVAIPVQLELLAGLGDDVDGVLALLADGPVTLVDQEAHGLDLAFGRGQVVDAEAPGLGLDESPRRPFTGSYLQGYQIVAIRDRDTQLKRLLRGRIIGTDDREVCRGGRNACKEQTEKEGGFLHGCCGFSAQI